MRQRERIVAEIIRAAGAHRWVGIYEVDHRQQRVVNLAWSGPCGRRSRTAGYASNDALFEDRRLGIKRR